MTYDITRVASGVVDRCMIVDTNEIDQAAKDSGKHNFDS